MVDSSSYAVGVVSQLLSPLFMTVGFIIWENRWVGSAYSLNLYKCVLGSVLFTLLVIVSASSFQFQKTKVGYLLLSSTLGIVIGDVLWLEALRLIGARRVIVIDTIKPFAAAILGLCLLNEQLNPLAWVGMFVAVFGVLIVTLEKERIQHDNTITFSAGDAKTKENQDLADDSPTDATANRAVEDGGDVTKNDGSLSLQAQKLSVSSVPTNGNQESVTLEKTSTTVTTMYSSDVCLGYFYAVSNALFDTFGTFLTKKYGVGMTIWEINLIRFGFAAICMVAFSGTLWIVYSFTDTRSPTSPSTPPEMDDVVKSEQLTSTHSNDSIIVDKETASFCCLQIPERSSNISTPWYLLPSRLTAKDWLLVSLGVVFVTFLCPALSTYGLFLIPLGLALTLGSTGPLYALPLTFWMQKKKPTVAGVAGAALAFLGIVLLSISGSS
jgi:drug/metabolite transporter (DMT)-like permease